MHVETYLSSDALPTVSENATQREQEHDEDLTEYFGKAYILL